MNWLMTHRVFGVKIVFMRCILMRIRGRRCVIFSGGIVMIMSSMLRWFEIGPFVFFFSSDNLNKNKNAQKFDAPSTKLQPPSQKTTSNHLPNANSYIPVQKQGDSRSGTNNTAIIIIKQWHQKRLNITHYSKIQPFIHQFNWTPSIQILYVRPRPRPKIRIWFRA